MQEYSVLSPLRTVETHHDGYSGSMDQHSHLDESAYSDAFARSALVLTTPAGHRGTSALRRRAARLAQQVATLERNIEARRITNEEMQRYYRVAPWERQLQIPVPGILTLRKKNVRLGSMRIGSSQNILNNKSKSTILLERIVESAKRQPHDF